MHVEDIASQSSIVFETQYTAWLKRHISGVHVYVPQVYRNISYERWDSKSPFNIILSQQHLCQKLPKSVVVHGSYSVKHQCRFFWDTVYVWLSADCKAPGTAWHGVSENSLLPDCGHMWCISKWTVHVSLIYFPIIMYPTSIKISLTLAYEIWPAAGLKDYWL